MATAPILAGDIKLLASKVMDDVPNGGGGPTGTVVPDGASNAVFGDVTERQRTGGGVSIRQLHLAVQTGNTAAYMDPTVIVSKLPNDDNVAITLAKCSVFAERTEIANTIENYLVQGPEWGGYLLENHVAGQRSIQLFQRPDTPTPPIGRTLVLVKDDGLPSEVVQYVRIARVEVARRSFTYSTGGDFVDYPADVVVCDLTDALRVAFPGSPPSRGFGRAANKAVVRETMVADAATFYGATPTTAVASVGDRRLSVRSIFTQLVPSAQTETPLSDIRMNGLSAALVATGGTLTRTLTLVFSPAQAMHVGAPIYPGSLSIVRDGTTLTDDGGSLLNGAAPVGTVDYENGIVTLVSAVFGSGGGTHQVTFTPAAMPEMISEQSLVPITAEGRRLSYAFVLGTPPLPRTLSVAFMSQGRWYTVRDDGSGRMAGVDSSHGAGTVNHTTGAVVVTLGALPDVGSALVVQAYSGVQQFPASNAPLANSGKAYIPINSDGLISEEKGTKALTPGSVTVGWSHGGAKVASDDGLGNLTGDATGTVDYSAGVVRVSPHVLPPPGTPLLLDSTSNARLSAPSVALASGSLGVTNITQGSVTFFAKISRQYTWDMYGVSPAGAASTEEVWYFFDRGGKLYTAAEQWLVAPFECGTVNYTTGAFTLALPASLPVRGFGHSIPWVIQTGIASTNTVPWSTYPGGKSTSTTLASGQTIFLEYASALPNADSVGGIASELRVGVSSLPSRMLRGAGFRLGVDEYRQMADDTVVRNPSPTTGGGDPVGFVSGAAGRVTVTNWTAGASSVVEDWRGIMSPPAEGVASPYTAFQTVFRTATAPIQPGSLSVLGTMQDGTPFNIAADINGKINGTRVKGVVDYEYGLVRLFFVNPDGSPYTAVDLTSLNIAGLTTAPADLAMLNSLRYSAVAYSYLPIDAEILGLDPVRLPPDGRVPIFRVGSYVVLGHSATTPPATLANGQTVNCARTRLSRVRVIGSDGNTIHTGYTADLDAGTVTATDVSAWLQPVTVEHRVEQLERLRDVQINGDLSTVGQLAHAFPVGTVVSSAITAPTLRARVSQFWDQQTWDAIAWADSIVGNAAPGTYNDTLAPIELTNAGALTERFALRFKNSTQFECIGEHVGFIGQGDINADFAPLNPIGAAPYFTIRALGWGTGWAVGNVQFVHTVGALYPFACIRTVQMGPPAGIDYSFELLGRGDVDRPPGAT